MQISVIVNGANGRMGKQVVLAISQDSNFKLLAELDIKDDLAQTIQKSKPDVVIDFTHAGVAFENTKTIIQNGAKPIIGTTGFTLTQVRELQQLCKPLNRGGIIVPNFSIGAVLMMRFAKQASHYFPHVEIIEMHHEKKMDAPSGTAIKTAEMISEVLINKQPANPNEQEILSGSRGAQLNNIPIHSVRLPGLLAHQLVMFGGTGETLTIRHDTLTRECFMPGVLLACKKVMELNELVYGLENVL